MQISIRPEQPEDVEPIRDVNRLAFGQEDEARLVDDLRDGGYVALSMVAVVQSRVVGHVLFTHLPINTQAGSVNALSLAPMAVVPEYQRQGVGTKLIHGGLQQCHQLGHRIVIVVGHPHYYPRFGFSAELAKQLKCRFGAGEAFMAAELVPGAMNGLAGTVEYPPPFDCF